MHVIEVAQAAVGDRTDAAGAATEKAAYRRFGQRGWVHAQLPATFSRFGFEDREAEAGLAYGYAFRRDLFELVHSREIENDATFERNALPVIAGTCAAHCDGDGVLKREAEDCKNLIDAYGLDNNIGDL
jgi:hypothetical protein